MNEGVAELTGQQWVGYITVREPALMDLQEETYCHLTSHSFEIVSNKPRDSYFPHFTLGRLSSLPTHLDTAIFIKGLMGRDIECITKLGLSDENGQFLNVIDE